MCGAVFHAANGSRREMSPLKKEGESRRRRMNGTCRQMGLPIIELFRHENSSREDVMKEIFDELLTKIVAAAQVVYGERLISVVLYGSVARGTMRRDSDVDLLIVARNLPRGRMKRVQEFENVDTAAADAFRHAASQGVKTTTSPVIKTSEEVRAGSPLFLDMVEDARVLYDRNEFFARQLTRLRNRLAELGAKRIWKGNAWYWDLKPDFKPGEVFDL